MSQKSRVVTNENADKKDQKITRNFLIQLISTSLTKLGDALIDAKTILPWIMSSIGSPVGFIGLLVPIRESGSLLPQLMISGLVKRQHKRKRVWVFGSLAQSLLILMMAFVVARLHGFVAGLGIVLLLVVFSLARSFCSVSSKDVIGRTLPKKRRGRLSGWASSIAGVITLFIGLFLSAREAITPVGYGLLMLFASALWLIAALIYGQVKEGSPDQESENADDDMTHPMHYLVKDSAFRHFVIVRSLLISTALAAPFYTVLMQQNQSAPYVLGLLVVLSGVSSIISGPLWGHWADHSSRQVMRFSSLLIGVCGLIVCAFAYFGANITTNWLLLAFFIVTCCHQGVRVSRKTYIVDMAEGDKRTQYVAISNSLIGILLLLCLLVGYLAETASVILVIGLLSATSLLASFLASWLPEVE